MMHHTKASSKFEENIITNTNKNDRENDTRAQDNVAANSTEAKISEGDILLQTGKIVRDWESVHHRSLKGKNKDIALKAAYIQLTQKRGISGITITLTMLDARSTSFRKILDSLFQ
jgi:membrane-associated HD superfamily phosphohydrolase